MKFKCRHCDENLQNEVINLGHQPASNAYLTEEGLSKKELTYPLKVFICSKCWLVQIPAHEKPEILFDKDYAYFSSTSTSWLNHSKKFVEKSIKKLNLNSKSSVLEIASNDGYLLQYFNKNSISNIGIEPTKAAASEATKKGVQTIEKFFGTNIVDELKNFKPNFNKGFDLIIANNVLAHVPDINDFIKGISNALNDNGKVSIEFPHLHNLIKFNQFDTIYHEHYSYLSLNFLIRLAKYADLEIFEVEKIPTHGGSLRVWLAHKHNNFKKCSSVQEILNEEKTFGLETLNCYKNFQKEALNVKNSLIKYLIDANERNQKIIGYGAAAKGNTLLNYAGLKNDLISHIVDKSESKQGKYTPGSHIPIIKPELIDEINPSEILVFPWNIINEILNSYPGKKFITALPKIKHWY